MEEELLEAAKQGDVILVNSLLDRGGNPNIVNEEGIPLLSIACKGTHFDVVRHLLERKANPNVTDKNGYSPIYWASFYRHRNIIKELLLYGFAFLSSKCLTT